MSSRVALVIGMGAYEDAPLKYCLPSAGDVFKLLISSQHGQCDPERSLLITDGESAITEANLDEIIKNQLKKITTNETAIFYYTGHASSLENELFLATNDADETVDGYRISSLVMGIRDRNITRAILIIDACQSTVAFETLEQLRGKLDRKIAILVSSGRYQFSRQEKLLERSLFSYYFCEGIERGCEGHVRRMDENIDIATLKDYINHRITKKHPLVAQQQEARVSIISEGYEKLWVSRIPALIPPKLIDDWDDDIKNELTTLYNLFVNGYLFPQKCEEAANTLKVILISLKDYSQGNKAVLDMLIQQLSVLINDVLAFKNYCQDTTEHSVEMRENIVEALAEISGDLDYL